ncbi:MAG: TRZ/ATZ family hydrolase [Sutterellaceae bacterium]|nr:TRZ/ATZ family hydrolase [Sutterellaceae bacterium]MDD7441880.1 TRZ/ATZ family hydrolase [Sutterellaceae bacterium]MDY2869113.1 TRZ/ATZ family hydrolase [Mesosutterella sp.]
MQVKTLLRPTWIIPIVPEGIVLDHHVVAIDKGKIAAVAPEAQASQFEAKEVVDLPGEIVMPGFVNLHSHAAMNLLRGIGPDLSLMDWLQKKVWPVEGKLMSPDFVYQGSRLAAEEMVQAGITCTNDQYFFPLDTARGLRESGMKCAVSAFFIGFPSAWAKTEDEYIRKAEEVIEHFRGDRQVHVTVGPHAPYTVGDEALKKLAAMSERHDLPIHIHVGETEAEIEGSIKQYGVRPIERLRKLGLVNPRLISVHSVHMNDEDIRTLAEAGASVCHCPSSNLKLASGFSPIDRMMKAGINIGIGTDGVASNDKLDMLAETRLAALLAKAAARDPTAASVHKMLYASTMGGARALKWDLEIGSLERGKSADLFSCRLEEVTSIPVLEPAAQLLYSAGRENITHVWIDGNIVVSKQQSVFSYRGMSRMKALTIARTWQNRL